MKANPSTHYRRKQKSLHAFTLVELLVAVSILALLLVLVLRITGMVMSTAQKSNQLMGALQSCRKVADVLGDDISNAVTQNGLTVFVKYDQNQNLQLAFLTRSRWPVSNGNTAPPRWMAVAYQIDNGRLIRRSSPVNWNANDLVTQAVDAFDSTDASVVASNIVRFETVALLDNGSFEPLLSGAGAWLNGSTEDGQPVPKGFSALLLTKVPVSATNARVRSLVVSVAALDDQTFQLPGVDKMAAILQPMALTTGQVPLDIWSGHISKLVAGGVPKPAVGVLQFMQTTYQLK